MRIRRLMLAAIVLATGLDLPAEASPRHHARATGRYGSVHYGRVRYGYAGRRYGYPALAGTVGTPIPPYAARFMGYPYNVPGYRYEYADACVLRVGGLFGPGPSAGPCPFGLDRPF